VYRITAGLGRWIDQGSPESLQESVPRVVADCGAGRDLAVGWKTALGWCPAEAPGATPPTGTRRLAITGA
jgi:hypothetical protein